MKKIIALSLVAGGLAFAQSGLQGGSSGIHQHNAYTLGKGGFEIGTGGDVSLDSWSHSRGGVLSMNGQERSFHSKAASLSGNVHLAVGLQEFLDLGVSLPLYYDHANWKRLEKLFWTGYSLDNCMNGNLNLTGPATIFPHSRQARIGVPWCHPSCRVLI